MIYTKGYDGYDYINFDKGADDKKRSAMNTAYADIQKAIVRIGNKHKIQPKALVGMMLYNINDLMEQVMLSCENKDEFVEIMKASGMIKEGEKYD